MAGRGPGKLAEVARDIEARRTGTYHATAEELDGFGGMREMTSLDWITGTFGLIACMFGAVGLISSASGVGINSRTAPSSPAARKPMQRSKAARSGRPARGLKTMASCWRGPTRRARSEEPRSRSRANWKVRSRATRHQARWKSRESAQASPVDQSLQRPDQIPGQFSGDPGGCGRPAAPQQQVGDSWRNLHSDRSRRLVDRLSGKSPAPDSVVRRGRRALVNVDRPDPHQHAQRVQCERDRDKREKHRGYYSDHD